ncbi:hypothetical protein P5673_009007 [Acropora cervicornis]|uniref:Uncharacterized protein n=1 Tax=Acropora cervicornis TaxID=6130 RepID=A0AAD9VAE8_ACRCE|nr:hypothetical protein P5673_009007 [Acropora cervicornis]
MNVLSFRWKIDCDYKCTNGLRKNGLELIKAKRCSNICSKKAGARWTVGLLDTKAKANGEPEKQNSMDFVRVRYDMKDFVVFFSPSVS